MKKLFLALLITTVSLNLLPSCGDKPICGCDLNCCCKKDKPHDNRQCDSECNRWHIKK